MKEHGECEDKAPYTFLTRVKDGDEWTASRSGCLYLREEEPDYQLDGMPGGPYSFYNVFQERNPNFLEGN
jgi:hypothetical protein